MSPSGRLPCLLALACTALLLVTPAGAGAQPLPLAFGACHSVQVVVPAGGLQCATLDVPFDRADPAAGSIALAVQRVPASEPRTGVIVLLAGGPGQPALPAFEEMLAPLAHEPALRSFELVAFDQRGTGQSEGLQCPEDEGSLKGGLPSYLGACGTALGVTRTLYTSQESVEDLDSLRLALGGTPLSLLAVSYGGRVAGMYAREYPQGVARMVLDSPAPPAGSDALDTQRLHALRRVLDEGICGAGACRSFSSDVYAQLTRVLAQLRRRPLRARIYDAHGRLRPSSVTEAGLLRLLFGLDLSQEARELAPAAIAAAAHSNVAPLARLTHSLQAEAPGSRLLSPLAETTPSMEALPSGGLGYGPFAAEAPPIDSAISIALFTATYCIENELPWSSDSAPAGRVATLRGWLASLPAAVTAPFAAATAAAESAISLCMGWPATPPAPPSPTGVSATPTLILSGEDDLRTPYEQDLTLAAGYSDARLLRVPDVGHSTVSTDRTGCARDATIEFIATGQAPASCPGSREAQALPLPPSSLEKVPAAASSSHLAGQVATAAAMTIEDLFGQTSFSGGGLRGGSWARNLRGFALHGMLDVPGVALSGVIRLGASIGTINGHLSVRGRLAGELSLRGLTLSGRLGRVLVHTRLAAL
ncbi:MAG TPA: alpha/beta fold hydrolase [Solirubrobacteraceae bacterium]|nr:alpha/beta fold hydrolase [Solirubrobacteraceae bacterium]